MPTHVAFIREEDCIGCTKCIAKCPTDAIVGASGFVHTVVPSLCIGCDLCLPPCPMNCIDLIEVQRDPAQQKTEALAAKARIQSRIKRLARDEARAQEASEKRRTQTTSDRKAAIAAALARKGRGDTHDT